MPTSALVAGVVVAAIVSRLLDVYLWRAGRISDQTAGNLLLARFPVVGLLYGLIIGASVQVMLAILAISLVPALLFYRFVIEMLEDQRREGL